MDGKTQMHEKSHIGVPFDVLVDSAACGSPMELGCTGAAPGPPPRANIDHMVHLRADADPLAEFVVVVRGRMGHHHLAAGGRRGVQKLRTP